MEKKIQEYFIAFSKYGTQELEMVRDELDEKLAHMTMIEAMDVLMAQKEAIDMVLKERTNGAQ